MKNTIKLIIASIIGSIFTILILYFVGFLKPKTVAIKNSNVPVSRTLYTLNQKGDLVALDFTGVSKKVMDGVVHIKSLSKQDISVYKDPFEEFFNDPFFRRFFGDPDYRYRKKDDKKREELQPIGFGSGVIISSDGYIVTNNHVIDKADEIEVILHDNRVFKARLVGKDPSTDIALLQIKANNLPTIPFGNSDQVEIGEWVLSVGNPFNLTSTVTAGIISAKGRNINILGSSGIESFLQTDAAVNPGNSGGALVNLKGELIGITTAIASPTGTYAGYGFAVPSNIVSKVVDDLIKYGMVQRAYLGIMVKSVDAQLAKEKDLKIFEGAYVDSVVSTGAAAKAGIKAGDVIIQVDDVKIAKTSDLLEKIGRHRPGDKVKVYVNRKGKELVFDVTLANQKGEVKIIDNKTQNIIEKLGIELENLDSKKANELGIAGGVVVKEINEGLIKKNTDMKPGFIITKINNKDVRNVKDVEKILEGHKGGVLIEGIYENYPGIVYYAFGIE